MLTLYDFHQMTLDEKCTAIWQGEFIGDRKDGDNKAQLYSLGGFYAEVFYDPSTNTINKIRAFRSTNLVEPYLSGIKLSL
ncbi:hypothetical protein IDJ77_16245 [Mucilaginibacter sp. ZT4R22]|uniref:Uncharacterized protein n=1 Tax=Mucilaginibacter pankratovii TaxID=2772110 RepID=A0ABR7WST8_9SPHI|nr:hypothetical protein [Mucilaginibacter pankratovii]MBD1365366.1 hypothetical protein [Mucilaginibacter pankratovii]